MDREDVILLSARFSPYAHRVQWALKLKGIQYEIKEEDLSNKSHLLLNLNPITKKVPVLIHHGKAIVDSLRILEYIDETWSHSPMLMPQDPYEKAMTRFWAVFFEEKLHIAIRRAKVFKGEKKEKEVNAAKEALEILDGMLKGKKFFGGDSIGYLDIALGWTILWLEVFEQLACVKVFESDKHLSIHKWMQNLLQLKVIYENLPSKDELVSVLQNYGQFSLSPILRN